MGYNLGHSTWKGVVSFKFKRQVDPTLLILALAHRLICFGIILALMIDRQVLVESK